MAGLRNEEGCRDAVRADMGQRTVSAGWSCRRLYPGSPSGSHAGNTPSLSHGTSALPGSAISSTEPYQ